MILVIDNYDSFTYNLVQYFGELGADVVIRRNDQVTLEEVETLRPDRICISPGPGTPLEAGISNELILRLGQAYRFSEYVWVTNVSVTCLVARWCALIG